MGRYFLGIDQGTTSTTALLINEKWEVVARGNQAHRQIYPQPGWVEHDPEEIFRACIAAVGKALAACPQCRKEDVVSLGIDNQGETCTIWEASTGRPIYNALVWQDRRTSAFCDDLKASHGDYIRQTTGLVADAYFSASKFRWILDNVEGAWERAARGELMAGTLDSFLIYRLTGNKVWSTDASTAGRTMLMDMHRGKWDPTMLELCGIPRSLLPDIQDCSCVYGYTDPDVFCGLHIPVAASLADAHAALCAQGCLFPGDIKTTYGTGVFMNMNTGSEMVLSEQGLTCSLPWQIGGNRTYALGGSAYIAGAAIQWLKDGLGIIDYAAQTQALAESVRDTGGVYFVPAFSGLAAPWWDQYARGLVIGITGGTTKAHLARAVLESIAFQVYDNAIAMRDGAGAALTVMKADGGPVDNEFLMQFQADLLGVPVEIPNEKETSAYGAAFLAALAVGEFSDISEVRHCLKLKKRYLPTMSEDERAFRIDRWHKAVERALNWAD